MTEAQLFRAGVYLIMIAAFTLIGYLIISLIMYKIKKKTRNFESETMEYPVKIMMASTGDVHKAEVDLEDRIINSTEALEQEASMGSGGRGFLLKDVREIVIPKEKMIAVRKGSEPDGVLNHLLENNISCCPVYFRSIDDILGIVTLKGLIRKKLNSDSKEEGWDDCIENPVFISSSISIQSAFNQMRQKNNKIAIVINEYAQTIGIVTEDDIISGILKDNQQK